MAIFSQEDIQRLLAENYTAGVTTKEQTQRHIDNLNLGNEQSLSFEWEVVMLNVLGKVGAVVHEKTFGAKNPDVYFISRIDTGESFIADIVTVSDEGHQGENPVNAFTLELERITERHELSIYNFSVSIGNFPKPFSTHSKTKLKLPRPENLHREFFNAEFKRYLRAIAENPDSPRPYAVKTPSIDIEIQYNPHQEEFKLSSAAYDVHPPQKQNPVLNALKRKGRLLKEAEYDGIRGVILCDGGSSMFHFRRSDALFSGSETVIEDFLRQFSSISFVLVVFVEILFDPYPKRAGYKVTTELYLNENQARLSENLRDTLNSLEQFFPIPVIDVRSIVAFIKRRFIFESDETAPFSFPPDIDLTTRGNSTLPPMPSAEPVLRKWRNPIKRPTYREYWMKVVTDVFVSEAEREEAAQAIANGAEGVDREGNILAPLSLIRRALEAHPSVAADVRSGRADVLYDPLTYQVILAFKPKQKEKGDLL
jgi:hypothetical protein